MNKVISVSSLQRQGASAFTGGAPIQYVLSNNQKTGLIFSKEAMELMEKTGMLEDLEDQLLALHMQEADNKEPRMTLEALKAEVL